MDAFELLLLLMTILLMDEFKLSIANPGEIAEISGLRSSTPFELLRQVGDETWQG